MKFSYGQWVNKQEYSFLFALEVQDWAFDGRELTVWIFTRPINGQRGLSLDQGTFTLHLTSDLKDTIRVQANHYEGVLDRGPNFEIAHEDCEVSAGERGEDIVFRAGRAGAVITRNPYTLTFTWDDEPRTTSTWRALSRIIRPGDSGEVLNPAEGTPIYMREQLSLAAGECIYGLGEHFTPLVRNGQSIDMWNEDGGTSSELTYKNIPFYVSSRNYGVFVNHTDCVSFEVASEHTQRVSFSVPGEQLSYFFLGGDNRKEVIAKYCALTGRPALPPSWSLGLWLSTSFTTKYDEETVTGFIDGMEQRNIPLHVFHFDCFWMDMLQWCNFEWDKKTFPDPKGQIERLHKRGLKVCVWINPYIGQKSPLFKEGMERGYLLKKPNGSVFQWDRWQAGMGLVDFTNPEAVMWYQEKLKALLDMGVDCFKTDFGERIPTNVAWFDGTDPMKMHNYYTYLYNKSVFELLERERGRGEALVFARSATTGGQKFPIHWGGDCWGTYPSMAESLRGGLSLTAGGFGFWSHDISGFESTATPDLYKRWCAFGLLSTHARLHGSSSYRVPWLFDDEASEVLRAFVNLRCRLMPYLWAQAVETHRTGVPMLRSMPIEFDDYACRTLDMQYMMGNDLLVAPIFNDKGLATYYLPKGVWTDLYTGAEKQGGTFYEDVYDYFHMPLYVRENTLLAMGDNDHDAVYDYADGVTLKLYALQDGKSAKVNVYAPKGEEPETELSATATREGKQISFAVEAKKPFRIELVGITADAIASVSGAKLADGGQNATLTDCAPQMIVTIK